LDIINSVFQNFNIEEKIPVFGFGAKISPLHTITSNCFALSENFYDPFFKNTKEIEKALEEKVIKNNVFKLNGPTLFTEIA